MLVIIVIAVDTRRNAAADVARPAGKIVFGFAMLEERVVGSEKLFLVLPPPHLVRK